MGIRCANHVTPLYPQNLALTSPTGGGRSVGIVRSRTNATEFFYSYVYQTEASCNMGTGSFPGVKRGRGVTLTPHPLLVPWSRKGKAIPLIRLWAVRPVQSLSVCTRVHCTLDQTEIRKIQDRTVAGRVKSCK